MAGGGRDQQDPDVADHRTGPHRAADPDPAGQPVGEQRPDPAATEKVYADAVILREALYRVFSAVAAGAAGPAADLATLNEALADGFGHVRLAPDGDGYRWGWQIDPPALDRMLWPVLRSAVELLTSDQLDRVKECPGLADCGWLFFDSSKNGSRRWCSMEGCGNRAKGRRHYQRTRALPA